ncbi:MAG TPA: class I SAM-dependent methyltransferase [Candidatus Sulfopaludibacter sp.]|nr:class I SAM-dependent methyltransferase [Candidatus Sulfopaludibacter sp.]
MAGHDVAAAQRFPGPDYREVLGWIHEAQRPETYVEIGVGSGCSLALARPETFALGIDPEPADGAGRVFRMTSREFFAAHDLQQVLGGKLLALAFIDGEHRFEQVVEDFSHLERCAGPGAIVAVHDTIPLDRETAARDRTTEFYTGDVWKILPFLQETRPDLEYVTVAAAPAGLTLIRGLDPAHGRMTAPEDLREFDDFELGQGMFLHRIANERAAVAAFCRGS